MKTIGWHYANVLHYYIGINDYAKLLKFFSRILMKFLSSL